MKTLSITLPDGLAAGLEKLAKHQGVTESELLRKVLEKELLEGDATNEEPSVYDLIKDDVGIVNSGFEDLSTNPKHLEGFGR